MSKRPIPDYFCMFRKRPCVFGEGITNMHETRKTHFMKNKLLCAILAVALFIPTVVAIVSYNTSDSKAVSAKLASAVVISDLDGKEFSFDKTKSEEDVKTITLLQTMLDNSEKIATLPDALVGDPFYKITFSVDKLETAYQFYFATDGTDSYYVMPDGTTYSVDAEYVGDFLSTECAQSIYTSSRVPVLTLSGEYTVFPETEGETQSSWMYKNHKGTYVASVLPEGDGKDSFAVEGGLSLAFSVEPDKLTVKVTASDGTELFNDLYANIGSLKLEAGAAVSVDATANWYEDEERDYFGTMHYDFTATVSAPAEFYPGVSWLEQGGMISITAVNVNNPDKITFTSSPDIGYSPVWYTDGDYVRTLIAFDSDLETGNYELNFNYAGTSQKVAIELRDAGFGTRNFTVDQAVLDKAYSDKALDEYKEALTPLLEETSDTPLWNGYFLANPASPSANAQISAGFGHMLNLTGKSVSFRHEGVDYRCAEGTAVTAGNGGKVVYVGELDYTGKIVVIDHGWGLKTWYTHLSSTTVVVGDEVKRGDNIGSSGSTGLVSQPGFNVAMSLFDQPVLPYSTWEDNSDYANAGIELGIPMYEKE